MCAAGSKPGRQRFGAKAIVLAFASLFAWTLDAAESAERVLFVQLRWESNRVSIVRADSAPGRLKGGARGEGRFQLQLMDARGGVLSTQLVEDPRVRRIEYPAANDEHALSRVQVTNTLGERTVRLVLPVNAEELVLLGEPTAPPPGLSGLESTPAAARPVLQRWRLSKSATPVRP